MFGSPTNTTFGSSTGLGTGNSTWSLRAPETAPKGTHIKFSVVKGSDSMVKNGITTNIRVRHQCITVMSNYDNKSIEELRIEDYEAGRKKDVSSLCSSCGILFGNTSGLGCSTSSSLTGPQLTTGFGAAVGSGFTYDSLAPTTKPTAPGVISVGSLATNATPSPLTEGLTLGKTSVATGTSNTWFTMGEAQPTGLSGSMFGIPNSQVGGFTFGSAPSQSFTLGTGKVGGFTFGSAPSQSFTLGVGKATAPATVNPTLVFTPEGATTPTSSASSGFTFRSGRVGGNPTSGLTLGAALVTKKTGGLSLGVGSKLGGTAATPASAEFKPVVASNSATSVIGLLSGLATTAAATATDSTASTGLTLGTTGTSTAPGLSFPPASGVNLFATQTKSLPTATTTGSLFSSSSKTAGLFGQRQTTEGPCQKASSLFGTPTSTGTRFGSGFSTTTSVFGQSSCGQTTGLSVATTTSAGLSCTLQTQAVENRKIKAAKGKGGRVLFGQTGFQLDRALKLKDHHETACKTEAIGSTGFSCLSTSTSKKGVLGNTSGTGSGTSSSSIGQEQSTGFATTGISFASSSRPAGLFAQLTTEGLGQKPGVPFNTISSATGTGIKLGTTTSSTSGLATGLSFATTTSAVLRLPETKRTDTDCGRTQSETGELLEKRQDDPSSLSPRFSLNEAMSEGMEELRKENESLRKVVKMYKENEKAMEELRRFYTAQAIKHKENMEQAVSHKFLELVSKVRDLKTIRDTAPEDGKTSVVIRQAIDLTRKNRNVLESLKSLHQVQECESALRQAQECLRQCKEKEELLATDIVAQRDKARKELFDSIDLFCQEVDLIPLQEREKSLQHALSQLQEQEDALDSCGTDPDLEVAVEAYEEWLQRSRQEITDVKQRINQCTEDLTTALSRLELTLKVSQDTSETGSIHAPFGDLDAMISALSSAIQEEMNEPQVAEDKGAKQIVDCAIKALVIELKREMTDLQELRDNLVPKYKSLQTDMSPWLEAKPDLKNVEDVRTTIESLRLRLRQRLADKKDLEEVESDISDIYLQLHKGFEDESNFLAELAKFASEHFPELPIAHPEVGISEYLASNGLVKPGRELEHYPHHDSVPSVSHDKCSVIKTEFAGRPCVLKELNVDRELAGIDHEILQRKAVEYHSVDCPFLMPLDAFFVTESRAFVQMPLLISGEEWLASYECSSEAIKLVLRDILDALNSLHLKNICHGSVQLQSVFVEKRSGVYRGVLDFFPFSNWQCSQTEDMKLFGDLIVKMNFPNKDTTTTFSQLTEDTDLLAVLGDLLDTDDVDRPTAQQTLQQAYFCKCV